MSDVPSISSSAVTALQGGFALLNQGAAEVVQGATDDPARPQDSLDLRSGSIMGTEPLLAGVRDIMLAKLQVGAGTALLHAYRDERESLFQMLQDGDC